MTFEDTLRPLIKEIVREVVAELRTSAPAQEYSSEHPADGVTRRTHNTRCAKGKVAGAKREGLIWRCTREAWHASFAAEERKKKGGDAYARRAG